MRVFDIETNAIAFGQPDWFKSVETIHCIVVYDTESHESWVFNDQPTRPRDGTVEEGVRLLLDSTEQGILIGGIHLAEKIDLEINRLQKTGFFLIISGTSKKMHVNSINRVESQTLQFELSQGQRNEPGLKSAKLLHR